MSTAVVAPVAGVRVRGLDAARGLAVVLMVGDHLSMWAGFEPYRVTFGRLAMPLFMVVAGSLVHSIRNRHLFIGGLGMVIPVFIPWLHAPNILVLWLAGCVCIVVARRVGLPVWLLPCGALVLAANGYALPGGGFEPASVVGLMGLGALVGPSAFRWADRLPGFLAWLGRRPIWLYAGHLAVIEGVVLLTGWGVR